MSAAVQPQAQVDFLKGEPHRKHPGVTNLKTLRLPEELQTAARSIIHSRFSYNCGYHIHISLWPQVLKSFFYKCCTALESLPLQELRWLDWLIALTPSQTSCGAENDQLRMWIWGQKLWAWRRIFGRKRLRREQVCNTLYKSTNEKECACQLTVIWFYFAAGREIETNCFNFNWTK